MKYLRSRLTLAFITPLLGAIVGTGLYGQTAGSITGEAHDATGAVIVNVSVTATNEGTGATRPVTTNEAGLYSFPSLPPGVYTLRAKKQGFKTVVRREIELHVQQAARIDLELAIGEV